MSHQTVKKRIAGLPHLDRGCSVQHITYRLADSVPTRRIILLQEEATHNRSPEQRDNRFSELMENALDLGLGSCVLANHEIADEVVRTWKHFEPERYTLKAYVVMPNHCHVLIQTNGTCSLGQIVLSWKSYTARRINEWKRRHHRDDWACEGNRVWYPDYWDRYIRSLEHYHTVVHCIENNPVKAGLVNLAKEWKWSSAASS